MTVICGKTFDKSYFVANFIIGLHEELQSFTSLFESKTFDHVVELGKKNMYLL